MELEPRLTTREWWLPTAPYSAIDAYNRAALATGSARYAQIGAHADYNGHAYHARVAIKRHRPTVPTYNLGYQWSGWNRVLSDTTFEEVLRVGLLHAGRARGSSLLVSIGEQDDLPARAAECRAAGLHPYEGPRTAYDHRTETMPWQCGGEWLGYTSVGHAHIAVGLERNDGVPASLFFEASSVEAWRVAVEHFRAERRARNAVTATDGM